MLLIAREISSNCRAGVDISLVSLRELALLAQIGIYRRYVMKTIALILGIVFLILTFAGGTYVLINHGQVSAGYAVVPSLWCIICFGFYRSKKNKE